MGKINHFDVLKRMGELDNKNFKLFSGETNLIEMQTGKDGWGRITMAVDNATITDSINSNKFIGLFIYNIDDFYKIKNEMESE